MTPSQPITGLFRKSGNTFGWSLLLSSSVVVGGGVLILLVLREEFIIGAGVGILAVLGATIAITRLQRRTVTVDFDGETLKIHTNGTQRTIRAPFDAHAGLTTSRSGDPRLVLMFKTSEATIILKEKCTPQDDIPGFPTLAPNQTNALTLIATTPYPGTVSQLIDALDLHPTPQNTFERLKQEAMGYSHRREWQQALTTAQDALAIEQDDALLNLCGVAAFALKYYDDAEDYYTQAIAHNPNNADAYNNRGLLRKKVGKIEGARADFEAALTIDPNFALARQNLKKLRR